MIWATISTELQRHIMFYALKQQAIIKLNDCWASIQITLILSKRWSDRKENDNDEVGRE